MTLRAQRKAKLAEPSFPSADRGKEEAEQLQRADLEDSGTTATWLSTAFVQMICRSCILAGTAAQFWASYLN